MNNLRPIEIKEYYINRITSGMRKYFWENIFSEIFDILKTNTIDNSQEDLIKALKSGTVWYKDGAFRTSTKFSNRVAQTLEQLGAKYSRNAYYLPPNKLPSTYFHIIDSINVQTLLMSNKLENYLSGLLPVLNKLTVRQFILPNVEDMVKSLQVDIIKTAQEYKIPVIELGLTSPDIKIPKQKRINIEQYWKEQDKKAEQIKKAIEQTAKGEEKIILKKQLFEHQKQTFLNAPQLEVKIDEITLDKESKKIAEDYVYNMNYWVKKWETKNIVKMRQDILDLVQKGTRASELKTYFEKKWKIAGDKAKFLADNESHLVGSVIKANEYKKLGCTSFRWGRSSSKEKRKLHEKYYDEVFDIDNPPVIDEKLNIKGLPRQIWNCKCHMLIIPPDINAIIEQREEIKNAKSNLIKYWRYKIYNSKQCNNNTWRYRRLGEG